MPIGERVKERREALGMSQPQLAKAVKDRGGSISQAQISGLEGGTVTRPRALPELALALRTTVNYLLTGQEAAAAGPELRNEDVISTALEVTPIGVSPEPLIIWRSVPSSGRSGEMLIYKEKSGLATRPVEMADSKDAFATRVVDDEAEPRYERRATLLVDPSTIPAEGDDCLFVRNTSDNPVTSMAPRRLVKITPEHWIVRKFQPGSREHKLDRNEWPGAWVIFGSYNRR